MKVQRNSYFWIRRGLWNFGFSIPETLKWWALLPKIVYLLWGLKLGKKKFFIYLDFKHV